MCVQLKSSYFWALVLTCGDKMKSYCSNPLFTWFVDSPMFFHCSSICLSIIWKFSSCQFNDVCTCFTNNFHGCICVWEKCEQHRLLRKSLHFISIHGMSMCACKWIRLLHKLGRKMWNFSISFRFDPLFFFWINRKCEWIHARNRCNCAHITYQGDDLYDKHALILKISCEFFAHIFGSGFHWHRSIYR